ncbi:hypothetical protein OG552_20615 [Streptomyces sp. NBC_01476]|uniref:hypothetical protein n=1 Tax=Streptomyces sp. NBC_01476 TaxID=2903881 RepID=UPI002E379A79|nr:hypothetical protein [Streptomyces sp. NBC_01476]
MARLGRLGAIGLIMLIGGGLVVASGLLHLWQAVSPLADTVDTFLGAVGYVTPVMVALWRQAVGQRRDEAVPQPEWLSELARAENRRIRDDLLGRGVTRATIDVRWEPAQHLGSGRAPLPAERHIGDLLDLDLDPYRLVVVGPAGSGKSIALELLAAELHSLDRAGRFLPVVLPLSGWTDAEPVESWTARELALRHPTLVGPEAGPERAEELAQALRPDGGIVLFLDGFDELAEGQGALLIERLNRAERSTLSFVLSSREDQITAAVAGAGPVRGAAAVRLVPTGNDDFLRYLEDSSARHADSWRQLLQPGRAGNSAAVAGAFDTPLMQWLGLQTYDHTVRVPMELADAARFPAADDIRRHLLTYLLPSVLDAIDGTAGTHGAWQPRRAGRWLDFLARAVPHSRNGTIQWWRLYRSCRTGMFLAYDAVAVGVLTAVTAVSAQAGAGLFAGALWGVGCGGTFTWSYSRLRAVQDSTYQTSGLFRVATDRWPTAKRLAWVVPFLAVPLVVAQAAAGLPFAGLGTRGLAEMLLRGLLLSVAAGLIGGLIAAIMLYRANGLDSQVAPAHAARPAELLRRDGLATAAVAVCFAAATAVIAWPVWPQMPDARPPALFWVLAALTSAAAGPPMFTAWPVFRAAHLWLGACDRLPLRYGGFLADLCQVGLMRTDGTAYVFRHDLLREALTTPR